MTRSIENIILSLIGAIVLLVAASCSVFSKTPGPNVSTQPPMLTETPATQHVPDPTATMTPEHPKRVMTVCTGSEPASLFIYGDATSSARTIWQAIYGGWSLSENPAGLPEIVKETPSQAKGTVQLIPVEVKPGDPIIAANGEWATLKEGVKYRPSGCREASCSQTYAGSDPVKIDQMVVNYQLQPGLKWSDGSPLTADDSLYSYEIAKLLYPAAKPEIVGKTQSYVAVDETTLQWTGAPGYLGGLYEDFFFSPLPRHAWSVIAMQGLAQSPLASQTPLGWGPYAIDEWASGDHVSLHKNPNYSGAAQGLPHFDTLVFRFTTSGKDALDALTAGECDLADDTTGLETQVSQLKELESSGKLKMYGEQNWTAWEQVLFNSAPLDPKQLNFFGQKEVRQAVAYCADRQSVAAQLVSNDTKPANSYVPENDLLYNSEVTAYGVDSEKGSQLLTVAGWIDADADPSTPRVAKGVAGVPDGTPFAVTYLVSNDEQSQKTAGLMKNSLAKCGIQVNVQPMSWAEMLASGPEGPVFGRRFDLAQFAWSLSSSTSACRLFLSSELPGAYPEAPKGWGGANAGGYHSQAFDDACQSALSSLPDDPGYVQAQKQAQAIFSEDLPALPLFYHAKLLASRPDFCGINQDSSNNVLTLNFAILDDAEGCR